MMKSQTRIPLFGVLMVCAVSTLTFTDAARERMTVEEDGITFKVDLFDDGRSNPYKVAFTQDGTQSSFRLSGAGKVVKINVGSDKYKVRYKSNGDLKKVQLTSSRRVLSVQDDSKSIFAAHELEGVGGERAAFENRRRSLYACNDCQETWQTVCDEGVPTVCDLESYGSPILATAEASIATMCESFGSACSRSGGVEACAGQCEDDESDDDDESTEVINSCLDVASDDYRCTNTGGETITFDGCGLVDDDVAYFPACFENFGKVAVGQLFFDNNLLTRLPEDAFDGLEELSILSLRGNQLVALPVGLFSTQTAQLDQLWINDNELTTLPEGIFDPLVGIFTLDLRGISGLQCVPTNSAYEVYVDSDNILQGTCECEPVEAVMCDEGLLCQPGTVGYTCG